MKDNRTRVPDDHRNKKLSEERIINYIYAGQSSMIPVKKTQPAYLKEGDEVAIVSPSFAVEGAKVESAVRVLEGWGLRVHVGKNALRSDGPFAGTDTERHSDFQEVTSNAKIKAVFCSRGGHGMLRIINRIDFSPLRRNPKWYIGYSDITVLHAWLSERCNLVSVHGEMPVNFSNSSKTPRTLASLYQALFGGMEPVKWSCHSSGLFSIDGEVAGGNLSMICCLNGTPAGLKSRGKILFIEDAGEYFYRIDRLLASLCLAGKLDNLAALVAGGFSSMEEATTPWQVNAREIITNAVGKRGYPVLFDFPAGHVEDNRAIYIGRKAVIGVKNGEATLSFR
jgi:muramoyltetrapeptide carboxypeptidase